MMKTTGSAFEQAGALLREAHWLLMYAAAFGEGDQFVTLTANAMANAAEARRLMDSDEW